MFPLTPLELSVSPESGNKNLLASELLFPIVFIILQGPDNVSPLDGL